VPGQFGFRGDQTLPQPQLVDAIQGLFEPRRDNLHERPHYFDLRQIPAGVPGEFTSGLAPGDGHCGILWLTAGLAISRRSQAEQKGTQAEQKGK
jgi:hypothetical protein